MQGNLSFETQDRFILHVAIPYKNGSREAILNAFSYHQNEDGGFGYALEADEKIWENIEVLPKIHIYYVKEYPPEKSRLSFGGGYFYILLFHLRTPFLFGIAVSPKANGNILPCSRNIIF